MQENRYFHFFFILFVFFLCQPNLHAEEGILALHVSNTESESIAGVVLTTKGVGSTSAPTDRSGKSRIRLSGDTKPGDWVSLQIVKTNRTDTDWVFISPWNGQAIVPPFERASNNYAPLVLAKRSDKKLL
jgi:hypothetical protein